MKCYKLVAVEAKKKKPLGQDGLDIAGRQVQNLEKHEREEREP